MGKTWAVLATGPSMSQALADSVRHLPRVAVSNAYTLAPDAEALASTDGTWWRHYTDAQRFAGLKFSVGTIEGVHRLPGFAMSTNSGLLGMHVAKLLGAERILLLGFDMGGSHYFGDHPQPLPNTQACRFDFFKEQFTHWGGPEVINCTPGSALRCFPIGSIEDYLC